MVLSGDSIGEALRSPVALGIAVGLLAGNSIGIPLFAWLGVKLKLARLPPGVKLVQVWGISLIAGIGFTVSLFITSLAFSADQAQLVSDAKIAILAASIVASIAGVIVLAATCPNSYKLAPNEHRHDLVEGVAQQT